MPVFVATKDSVFQCFRWPVRIFQCEIHCKNRITPDSAIAKGNAINGRTNPMIASAASR